MINENRKPHEIIQAMIAAREHRSDEEILTELAQYPALPDENDPAWERDELWHDLCRFITLADIAGSRKLKPAIRLILDRACYGDPGETMRGLRHCFEAIVNPDWSELASICLDAAKSRRLGTRLWAMDELQRLEDPRARAIFKESLRNDPDKIRWLAEIGLERLNKA